MKTLIAFASKHNYTKETVKILSEKLEGSVDVLDLKKENQVNLDEYTTIIIGSAIYAGQIRKEAKLFCEKNLDVLLTKKIGIFICCASVDETAKEQIINNFNEKLVEIASAKDYLGGEINILKLNAFEKIITKVVEKASEKEGKKSCTINKDGSPTNYEEIRIEDFAKKMN